ncbi:MAG: sigma-54-dependent Fis family transcriptional regulator [bacterium]|nr:sigma-54-dependent Fis family transcriptional regulator [bacterium]
MIRNILILDSSGGELRTLGQTFREAIGGDCVVHSVATGTELLATLRAGFPYHLVVVELAPGDDERAGLELLAELRSVDHDLPLVAVAERGDVDSAGKAVAAGATDFLVLGQRLHERVTTLLGKVRRLVRLIERKQALEEQNRQLFDAERERYEIIGDSPQIKTLIERVKRVATIPRPLLITGERGTGKELVARAIHAASGNRERAITAVNCAAFPDTLLESELFGHERGAFSGADRRMPGKFELANGGTLFLDEIGCMSVAFQQKILRTVEYGVFTRVGGTQEIRSTARIIAATNADLTTKMEAGEFLRDLYDRLAFEVIHVPALRDREGDVELLARRFLTRFMREIPAFRGKHLSEAALKALGRYPFPGNVRELKNIIERAAYRDTTNEITPENFGLPANDKIDVPAGTFEEKVEAFKRTLIMDGWDAASGNQARAARSLGLSYHQFRYYYRKYSRL